VGENKLLLLPDKLLKPSLIFVGQGTYPRGEEERGVISAPVRQAGIYLQKCSCLFGSYEEKLFYDRQHFLI